MTVTSRSPHAGSIDIQFRVNGADTTVQVEPMTRLSRVLRDELGLTGTKVGCDGAERESVRRVGATEGHTGAGARTECR